MNVINYFKCYYLQSFNFICGINKESNYIPGEERALACLYICRYVRVCVCVYMYVVCMYVYVYACMYITV